MEYQFSVETVEPRLIAASRGRVRSGNLLEVAMPLADKVWEFIREHPEIPQPGINIWLYLPEGSGEEFVVKVGAEVLKPFDAIGPVVCSQTPGGLVAKTLHIGPYSGIPGAHAAIKEWCGKEGRTLAGSNWEIYGHWNEDESKLQTEICYLLKQ
jgi:effector-binding domain-containing protein